jgi:hypothetical protein
MGIQYEMEQTFSQIIIKTLFEKISKKDYNVQRKISSKRNPDQL